MLVGTSSVQAAPRTWTVIAGGATKDTSVYANAFFPRSIDIAVGDTVTWQFEGFHNVAFLGGEPFPPIFVKEADKDYGNPKVFFPVGPNTYDGMGYRSSGTPSEPGKPFSYSLTFTKAGQYRYVCVIHGPGMGGVVNAKPTVSGSPEAVMRRARAEQAAAIKAGQAAWAADSVERKGNAITVPLIGNLKAGYSIFRFTRSPLVVSRGTTVTWMMRDPYEIHTITFTGAQKPPEFIIPQPQQQGPPRLLLNPQAAAPTGTRMHDGMGYVNSGILFPPGLPGNPPSSYSLSFTKPGTYEYWCLVHVPEGMKGTIVVK